MTLRSSDTNQHDALYKIARAYPGGIEALAARMGKSTNTLRNKLQPHISTHYVSFEEVSEIVELCAGAGVPDALLPLRSLNWRHGLVSFAIPSSDNLSDEQLSMTVCRVMKEAGDVAASVGDAMSDGRISLEEMDRIEREFSEAMGALGAWRERVRERFATAPARANLTTPT